MHFSKVVTLLLIVAGFLILYFSPLPLDGPVHKAMAILFLAAALWISEALPLPVTALIIPILAAVTGLLPTVEAFRNFAHPIIFLFFGGFVLATSLSKYDLDKWVATNLISLAGGNFIVAAILMMLSSALISMWVSNTSTTAMMLPLGLGLLALANKSIGSREAPFLLLGLAYAANIGGVATLIGSPPNAIGASALGLSFTGWLKYGIPIFILTFPVLILVLYLFFRPDRKLRIEQQQKQKLIMTRKVIILLLIFGLTVLLWLLEAPLKNILPLPADFASIVAVAAVIFISASELLSWKEIEKGVDWGVLILFGGGITLGAVLESSGFGIFIADQLSGFVGELPLFFFILIIVIIGIAFTEFMSNTASAALFIPVLYSLSLALNLEAELLIIPATLAATYGFMLPVGTPPNAIVFGSGLIRQRDMIRVGLLLNIIFAVMITTIVYFMQNVF